MKSDIFRKLFVHPVKSYVLPLIIAVFMSGAVLLTRSTGSAIGYFDALSVGGSVDILIGLLVLASAVGAFDTWGYSFSSLKAEKRKYHDLYEYSQAKEERNKKDRFRFVPYILVGAVFILVAVVIEKCKI